MINCYSQILNNQKQMHSNAVSILIILGMLQLTRQTCQKLLLRARRNDAGHC